MLSRTMAGAVLLAGAVVAAAENAPTTSLTPEFESIIQDKEEVLKTQMEGTEPGDMRSITVVTDDNVSTLELGDVYKNNACYYKVTEIRSKGTSGGKFVVQRIGGKTAPGRKWSRVSGLGPLTIVSRETVLEWFFGSGGWVGTVMMGGIAALMLGAIIILINSLVVYRRARQAPQRFVQAARDAIIKSDVDEFNKLSVRQGGLLAGVCRAMVADFRTTTVEDMQTRAETEAARQVTLLRVPLKALNFIAVVAPLLGLSGTVWGLMQAFESVAEEGASAQRSIAMADGIRIALRTTVAGLFVAVIALIVYFIFTQVLNLVVGYAQGLAVEFSHSLATIKRKALAAARAKMQHAAAGAQGPEHAAGEAAAEG